MLAGQLFLSSSIIQCHSFPFQSLATGRLATFSLPFVDCELPSDPDQTMDDDGTPQPSCTFLLLFSNLLCTAQYLPYSSPILEGSIRRGVCLRRRTRDPYFARTKVFHHSRPGPESAGHGTPVVRPRSATPGAWSRVDHVPFHAHELP